MRTACTHLKVVETDDCMSFSVLLLGLVHFVHFGLNDFTGTLVPLAEVGKCCLPTVGLHAAKS